MPPRTSTTVKKQRSSARGQMTTKTLRPTPANIARLARALQQGQLVAAPTETVYGLAGNALDPKACAAIFSAKGRPSNDPLIIHIHAFPQLKMLAETNPAVPLLARAFWPGPLTLVLPKKSIVPDLATSGLPSVAIRMPAHPAFRALLKKSALPLAAPSANPFGYISPTSAAHVRDSLSGKIPYILDGGACAIGLESTILDIRNPKRPKILRPGAISATQISKVLGVQVASARRKSPAEDSPQKSTAGEVVLAPGMLSKHYSPRTPLTLRKQLTLSDALKLPKNEAAILLAKPRSFAGKPASAALGNIFWLSETGSPAEIAHALFGMLRSLDRAKPGWKHLHASLVTGNDALAIAINDRLMRAAAKR